MKDKKTAIISFMPNMVRPQNFEQSLKGWCGAKALSKTILLVGIFITSCSAFSSRAMTKPDFEQIQRGASITAVEAEVGPPYDISTPQAGVQQYRYIERIDTGPGNVSQNTYILTVVNGQVIDKKCSNDSQTINLRYR